MLAENLLNEIGFSDEQQKKYFEYKALICQELAEAAEGFMLGDASFASAVEKLHLLENEQLHKYTINMLFVLECTSFLLQRYEQRDISKEIFVNSMKDVKYKLEECLSIDGIFGVKPAYWYERFLDLSGVALGRLQFNTAKYEQKDVTVCGYALKRGDLILNCHIPSSGPLKPELCEESFKMAYEFFKKEFSDGVIPITCNSWLLYPPYKQLFGGSSNTGDFIRNFEVIITQNSTRFVDAWRVFGMNFDGDITKLPQNTTMQRNFAEYIKQGGSFGTSIGLMLLDGERVLTRK